LAGNHVVGGVGVNQSSCNRRPIVSDSPQSRFADFPVILPRFAAARGRKRSMGVSGSGKLGAEANVADIGAAGVMALRIGSKSVRVGGSVAGSAHFGSGAGGAIFELGGAFGPGASVGPGVFWQ